MFSLCLVSLWKRAGAKEVLFVGVSKLDHREGNREGVDHLRQNHGEDAPAGAGEGVGDIVALWQDWLGL
jgi:hypothetical protein